MTCMGEGLSLGLYLLEKRKAQYKATGVDYYQPILVVMSDGHPNGDRKVWEETTERIRELGTARKLSVVAVGIGNDADMEMLAKVSPRQRPVRLNGLQFREFFAWLSRSVANVSASLPGEEPNVDLEALEALSAEPWPENTTLTSGFVMGHHDAPVVSSTVRSAFMPTFTSPQSSRPCASAPPRVAAAMTCLGEMIAGSSSCPL